MKFYFLALIVLLLFSCDQEEENVSFIEKKWYYISYFGAEGPQCNYAKGDKIYTFGASILEVKNNYYEDDICNVTFLHEGNYTYEVRMINGIDFLFIDDTEQGSVIMDEEGLLLDSSVRSDGVEVDDAPSYRFVS